MTPRLSAIIITHDEERHLGACLASLRGLADEVVVLDDGSSDATVAIARAAGARVEHRPFDGFGAQKQAVLELASGEWVLSIDADERVTPALSAEIGALLEGAPQADGYWIRRELRYLGAPLRFGGTGSDRVLRLARRARARFELLPVHERMVVEGREARLRHPMVHIKYETLREHLADIDRYTEIIAREKSARGGTFRGWHVLRIPVELLGRLVFRLGILDGRAGVIWAGMASFYGFLKYAKMFRRAAPTSRDAPSPPAA